MAKTYRQLELDRQLCFSLYAASRAVVRSYAPLLDELGLTYPQYVTMLALWSQPAEPATVGDLGARLHLDSGTLTPLLKRLESLGYVRRTRDADDERRVLITLTDAGLALRDDAAPIPATLVQRVGLTLDEISALRDQLTQLTDVLESAEG